MIVRLLSDDPLPPSLSKTRPVGDPYWLYKPHPRRRRRWRQPLATVAGAVLEADGVAVVRWDFRSRPGVLHLAPGDSLSLKGLRLPFTGRME